MQFQIQDPNLINENVLGFTHSYKPFKSFGLKYGISKYIKLSRATMLNFKFFIGTNVSNLPQISLKDELFFQTTYVYAKTGGNFGIQLCPEIGLKIRKFNIGFARQWIFYKGNTTYEIQSQFIKPTQKEMKVKYNINNLLLSIAFIP